mgnify:CR=1 FL=1
MKKLIKGSKAAKDYMAKIRAKKHKAAPKDASQATYLRDRNLYNNLLQEYVNYEARLDDSTPARKKQVLKRLDKIATSLNNYERKLGMIPKKRKLGATLFVEKGESPLKPKKTKILQRNRTPIGKSKAGTFRGNTRIGLTSKINGLFDTTIIKNIDELKKEYFKLAKMYHPDKGGTTAQFQELQNEYEKHFKALLKGSNLNDEQQANEIVIDEAIKTIIDSIISIDGLEIELIGKWLWVGSSLFQFTTPTYNLLKSVGLTYIKKGLKPYMVYRGIESTSRGKMSKEDINKKYGVHKFDSSKSKKLGAIKQNEIKNKSKVIAAFKKLTKAINKRPI